ncbi:MAG: glycosyltransferase family 4 protein [Gaiellaceae bacterium]
MKPRVLYIAYDLFSHGGIQRYSRYELRALRELMPDAQLTVCSFRARTVSGFSEATPVDIVGSPGFASRLRFSAAVLRWAIVTRPELVICDHLHLTLLGWAAARPGAGQSCVNVYGLEAWGRLLPWRRWPLLRATRVVSGCRFTKEILEGRYPELGARISVVEDCVDVSRFIPGPADGELRRRLGLSGRRVVLTVSRLAGGRSKGHDRVLEAMAGPLGDLDFTYLVVGDGDDRERIERRAHTLGLADRVVFGGAVEDAELPCYYRLCDVFTLASGFRLRRPREGEGIPLVVLEAQATGKPVVTSRLDGSAESIVDGVTGLLVDPNDVAGVGAALRRLLTEPEVAAQMGIAARRLAEERFSFEHFCERLGRALPERQQSGAAVPVEPTGGSAAVG